MESTNPVERGTQRALASLAEKHSELVFNDLLAYASRVCLQRPPHYLSENEESQYAPRTSEAQLAQNLGARGLATLLELKAGIHQPPSSEVEGAEYIPGERGFHVTEIISHPEDFSNSLNLRVLENAERFGQALIDESFAVLGKNASGWADKLKNAQTEEDECEVISWLESRMFAIANKSRSNSSRDDEDAHFYPPFRISPKFIGSYPHLNVQPSCLSSSIIATSFFEKAGKPVIHAGVMTPTQDTGTELLLRLLDNIFDQERATSHGDRDLLLGHIATMSLITQKWAQRPAAQHGVVYTKLQSGWWQFDTYGEATTHLLTEENAHLDDLHEAITDWHALIPNLEFSTSVIAEPDQLLTSSGHGALAWLMDEYHYDDSREQLAAQINQALSFIPDESYETHLLTHCLTPLLATQHNRFAQQNEDNKWLLLELLQDANTPEEFKDGHSTALRESFSKALHKFVLWGTPIEEFIHRCAEDPTYRQRRSEDFLNVPMLMGIYLAKEIAESSPHNGHLAIDAGSPAMRIGLAVLSDFARYDNHPLPASFWITHWPGMASALENYDNPPASEQDQMLIFNTFLTQKAHPFTSNRNYDKINSFLSTAREEKQDGIRQG